MESCASLTIARIVVDIMLCYLIFLSFEFWDSFLCLVAFLFTCVNFLNNTSSFK